MSLVGFLMHVCFFARLVCPSPAVRDVVQTPVSYILIMQRSLGQRSGLANQRRRGEELESCVRLGVDKNATIGIGKGIEKNGIGVLLLLRR